MRTAHVWNAVIRSTCALVMAAAAWSAEIAVSRNGVDVPDSGVSPPTVIADSVSGTSAGSAEDLVYTITNLVGSPDNLTIATATISDQTNCTAAVVGTWPVGQVTPGASVVGTIRVVPTASGTWSFVVSFATNDGNENPYNFKVSGSASAAAPEINVRDQLGVIVADGGLTSPVTGTAKGLQVEVTCTIENLGAAVLNIPGFGLGTASNCVAVVGLSPATSVVAGGTTTFSVRITPGIGAWSVPVQIINSDTSESVYDLTIRGTASGPDIAVSRDNVQIAQDIIDVPPLTTVAGEPASVLYDIVNTGSGTLNIFRYAADSQPGHFQFTASRYWTTEGGAATVGVERVGGIRGAVSVDWYLDNESALGGIDYPTGQSGTLSWVDGETGIKTFTVNTSDDIFAEATESIRVSIFGPTGGADLADLNVCWVYLEDQDVPGASSFGRVDYTGSRTVYTLEPVDLNTRIVLREVSRTGADAVAPDAYFEVRLVDGTATMGLDYGYATSINGWIVYAVDVDDDGTPESTTTYYSNAGDPYYEVYIVGNNKAYIPVRLLGDLLPEANESIHLQFSNQSGCLIGPSTLSDPSEYWSTIFVTDDDPAVSTTIITEEVNCTVALASVPDRILASGSSTALPLKVTATTAGAWQFKVTIDNDDPDEGSYSWVVAGNAAPDVPDITVLRNAAIVADDGVDTVTGLAAGVDTWLTYVIRNDGTANLVMTAPLVDGSAVVPIANCTATGEYINTPTTLTRGETTTVMVRIHPTVAGFWSAALSLGNDDPDESPYNFTIQGIATASPEPEFQWYRSGAAQIAVATGGTDDRGADFIQNATYDFNYLIANAGSANLVLNTGADAITASTGCSSAVIQAGPMASSVAASAQTTVTFRVVPNAATWSFTYSVGTNDSDENPATITVSGTASAPAPEALVSYAGSGVSNGATVAPAGLIAGQLSNLSFAISNIGGATLNLAQNYPIDGCLTDADSDPLNGAADATGAAQSAAAADVLPSGTAGACLYVGVDAATPFGGVVVTASTAGVGGAMTWEYYTGTGWSALTMTALSGSTALTATSNVLAWAVPSDWTAVTLGGTSACWVRAQVSTTYGTAPQLSQIQVGVLGNISNCTASLATAPSSTVAVASATTVVVALTPTVPGVFTCDVAFDSDDADEDPVYWTIAGSASQLTPNAPEIQVERNAVAISDGSFDNQGALVAGQAMPVTYILRNIGAQNLVLGDVAVTAAVNCAVRFISTNDTVILPTSATQVVLEVTPTVAGSWSCTWSVTTNDSDENPTDITLVGTATASPQAELVVSRSGITVVDGGTDSVVSTLAGVATLLDYTVADTGALDLTIYAAAVVSGESNCTVTIETNLPGLVASMDNAPLRLWITPSAAGAWSFDLSFTNSDADENPWNVTVSGTATVPTRYPEIEVRTSSAVVVDDGGTHTLPLAVPSAVAQAITYTIYNLGDGPLRIVDGGLDASPTNVVDITAVTNCSASIATPLTNPTLIAAGASQTLTISVTPTLPVGQSSATWSVVLSITSQDDGGTANDIEADQDETVMNWTLSGTVQGPEVAVTRDSAAIADGGIDPTTSLPASTASVLSYTVANSGISTLTLANPTITGSTGCVASVGALGSTTLAQGASTTFSLTITPNPSADWTVSVSMVTDDADENPYTWTVTGYYGPDISLARGTAIATGGTDTVADTAVGTAKTLTYTVSNLGQTALTGISASMTSPVNCTATIIGAVPTSIAAGSSGTIGVSITPAFAASASGWTVDLTVVSNDPDEGTYVVHLTSGTPAPEVELYRGTILNDGAIDSVSAATVATKATTLTYTIRNIGLGALTLSGVAVTDVAHSTNCTATILAYPTSPVASGASTTCQIQVVPTGPGTWTFAFQFDTDDSDEDPTNVAVTGSASPFSPGAGDLGLGGGGGGCGAGSATGLILMGFALVGLRRRRR